MIDSDKKIELHNDQQNDDFELIKMQKSVQCSILKEGYKKVEMKYFFCKCDPDQKDPICVECSKICHVGEGHEIIEGTIGKQICHCGERNHVLETKKKSDKTYNTKCFFHELSINSGLNVFYETNSKLNICMYCRNFCNYESNLLTKRKEKKVPTCDCDKHLNVKDVFLNLNKIAIHYNLYDFEDLSLTQMVNLIFNSKKSFENIYKPYEIYLKKFRSELLEDNFVFDPNIGFSVFSYANSNFSLFFTSIKYYYYFSNSIKKNFTSDYVFKFIETKGDNSSFWAIKNNIFCIFRILSFLGDFNFCPFLKINDIQNLHPLQRLILASNVRDNATIMNKYVNNLNFNLLKKSMDIIEKFCISKVKINGNQIHIMKNLYSICKIYGKFNLFTNDNIIRFCEINDLAIHKFSEARKFLNKDDIETLTVLINLETSLLLPMMKCLTFVIYYYNDQLVEGYLDSQKDLDSLSFFHTNSEIAQLLVRNVINVTNFIRLYYEKVMKGTDSESKLSMKKILKLSVHLTSIAINNQDEYLLGFRRLLDKNTVIYLNYIKGTFNSEEQDFISTLQKKAEKLEEVYQQYFEMKINEKDMLYNVVDSVDSILIIMDSEYTVPKNVYDKGLFKDTNIRLEKSSTKGSTLGSVLTSIKKTIHIYPKIGTPVNGIQYRRLVNKSFYLFSLVKSIKIISNSKKIEQKNKYDKNNSNINDDLFNKIITFLFYLVENDSDNCILILSSEIIASYEAINYNQAEKLIDLYYYCLSILNAKAINLSSFRYLMTFIKSVFNDLNNKPNLVKIFEKAFLLLQRFIQLTVANENYIFKSFRKLLKKIHKQNDILSHIKQLFLNSEKIDNGEELNWHREFSSPNFGNDEVEDISVDEKKKVIKGKKKVMPIKNGKSLTSPKTYKEYNLDHLLNSYLHFLNLINLAFDGSSTLDETEFLNSILTPEEIIEILSKRTDLDLSLRTELLKFYRMAYIDLILDKERIMDYNSTFINPVVTDGEGIYINDIEYYKFLNDIVMIKKGSNEITSEYKLLKFELLNFREILKNYEKTKYITEYLESGIIMPLNIFFNKFMTLIFNHKGYDFVKFYEIVYYFLEFKKYLIQNKELLSQQINKKRKGIFDVGIRTNTKKTVNINNQFLLADLEELEKDIKEITEDRFEILNYKVVYSYLEKHFKGFLLNEKSKSLRDFFSKKKLLYNEEKKSKLQSKLIRLGLLSNDYENKVLQILITYENEKVNFAHSSFIKNLDEVNVLYDTKNRNLLTLFLLFLNNHNVLSERYKRPNLFTILKILQYDTVNVQQEIFKIYSKNPETLGLHGLVNEFMICLNSLVLSTCNPANTRINEDYIISVNILKILKYLCEEHNRDFQKIFMQRLYFSYEAHDGGQDCVTLFNLLLLMVGKIILLSKWDKVEFDVQEQNVSYYYDIFFTIIEFLIEMIQGTESDNFFILLMKTRGEETKVFQLFLTSIKGLLLQDENDSQILYNVRTDLVNFLMAFLEEKETPEKVIKMISIVFQPSCICETIVNTMKKLYLKKTGGDVKEYNTIQIDSHKNDFFEEKFFNDKDFLENREFILANRLYQYIRLLADEYNDEEAISILNLKSKNQYAEVLRFFDLITKTVYIYKDKQNFRVLFTVNPLTAFLSANTKIDFLENVNRETRYTKLFGLIENSEYFFDEIIHNHENKNWLKKFLNEFKYLYFEMFDFLLVFIANFLLLYYLERDSVTEISHSSIAAQILEIIVAILNSIVIICWFYTKFQLYCEIELKKYALIHKKDLKRISLWNKIWVKFWYAFVCKNEVTMIFYNMVLAIIGSQNENLNFLYCFQLFTLINLSVTLKNIVSTITLRWNQIFSIIVFIAISVYLFSFAGFNFLNSHHEWNNELENQCETLFYCFLTNLDLGIRTDGGIGEYLPRYSFQVISKYYMKIFIFIDLYFIVIIVVMIAVLLGVIIDTFVELRETSDKQTYSKESICFICGASRDELEKDNINYENHVNNDHFIWNYAFYMIGLRFEDPQELNAINSYAYEAIEKKAISWIPPYDGLTLKLEESSEEENEHK